MKYTIENNFVMVRLFRGEEVFSHLEKLVSQEKWKSGFVSGIGAIEKIEVGAYDLANQKYVRKNLPGIHELAALQGNFVEFEGKPFFHLHGIISDHDLKAMGGHFFKFEVAATVEVKIQFFNQEITRSFDEEIGLNLLNFCGHSKEIS